MTPCRSRPKAGNSIRLPSYPPDMERPDMPATDVTALIDFDSLLSAEERLIQETVRDFVARSVRPSIADWFERGLPPRELARELGALGLFGMHLVGYGCAGTSAVS